VGGTWGALATGIFASTAVNPAGADGLLRGGTGLLRAQAEAVAFTWIFAFILTFAILKALDRVLGLRVPPEHEQEGLDVTQHSESAYAP
jgi:Amt family ammonium transporter